MKKTIANILSSLLILTLAGCNLPGNSAPGPASATPTEIPEPLPSGYVDLLQEKIASGEWTLEEGLVTMLKLFAGEIPASQASLGEGVLKAEGFGILHLAGDYLRNGTDQAVKDEITRLINLLVPTQEALAPYSIPEDQASGRAPGLAAPARQDLDCASLWASGYSDERFPSYPCFLVGGVNIAGGSYQVYYPLDWYGGDSHDLYYYATLEAIQDTIPLFQTYGTVKWIYFVFNTLGDAADSSELETLAWADGANFLQGTEACPVIIFPAVLTMDLVDFKQTIAHEIFHCFQAWNLPDQDFRGGDAALWWLEGTSEYFSNLVYPDANNEYEWATSFSSLSSTTSLVDMTYENFVFFQFMGNRLGAVGLIDMLRSMPTTPGRAAQLAALAAIPGMNETFDEFVRANLDNTLLDSDGTTMDVLTGYSDAFLFTDIASRNFSGEPFVFARYLVIFDSEESFAVETLSEGEGHSGWRPMTTVGGWGPVPETVNGGCEDLLSILYVITTTPGTERTETVATTMVSEAPCDECLIGRWEATNDSIVSYMQSVASAGGDTGVTVESATGSMFMEFLADGNGFGGYENLEIHETGVGGVASTEVFVSFEGFSSGPFTADGSALIGLGGTADILVTVKIVANGVSMGTSTVPFRPEDFPVSSTASTRYTCEGDTLTMWPPVEGITVEPVVYHKRNP